MLNPVVDDPSDHLEVKLATGLLVGRSPRGEMCIRVFGLNLRERLVEGRQDAVSLVKAKFDVILHNPDPVAKQKAIDELVQIRRGEKEFSVAGRAAITEIKRSLAWLESADE